MEPDPIPTDERELEGIGYRRFIDRMQELFADEAALRQWWREDVKTDGT